MDVVFDACFLTEEKFSEIDQEKINQFTQTLRDYLKDFGFSSFDPNKLKISPNTLHPIVEDLDWYFESSASDNVREIWAFTLSLLSLSHSFQTNHLRLLMFDEPRQQSAKGDSLKSFLNKASVLCQSGGQIIMTTSEDLKEIEKITKTIHCKKLFLDDGIQLISKVNA